MFKKLLSRLFSRQGRERIIEDPRFRENEIGTKLVGFREQMTDFSVRTHQERSAEESRREALKESLDAKERHEQIIASRSRKYVSEITVPEGEIVRPNDSAVEKANE